MPVRVEQQSLKPPVFTFHDVISDREISKLKNLAMPKV